MIPSASVRRWIYGLLLAGFPVAVFYDLVDVEAAPLWLAVGMAALRVEDPAPYDDDVWDDEESDGTPIDLGDNAPADE